MDCAEEQADEFEALASIFMEDFSDLATVPASCMIAVKEVDSDFANTVFQLKFTLPGDYPGTVPCIQFPLRSGAFKPDLKPNLLQYLKEVASDNQGLPSIFTITEAAKDWLKENLKSYCVNTTSHFDPKVEEKGSQAREERHKEAQIEENVKDETASSQGKWDFVIGLVGKPSAGKSTFFNAATKGTKAKVGAHPFTTIDPNFAQAFYTIPDPGSKLGVVSAPAYGKPNSLERYVPVLLKDVAGLVPGASDGKGRGNRFLNDLCDADVLIHVVDASGKTDAFGEPAPEGHDPGYDVTWLLDEIRAWIHGNLARRWKAIVKRPERLADMFSGYHCSPKLVRSAFVRAGLSTSNLAEELSSWGDDVVHRLVSAFVAVRFPILLLLNKSDDPSSRENIAKLSERFADWPRICASARVECELQKSLQEGQVLEDSLAKKREELSEKFGGTNVHLALNRAVELRAPTYAFPVHDLSTLTSHEPQQKGQSSGVLRDCLVLKPGTTVQHLHTLMRQHYRLVTGDFVRAEALTGQRGQTRIVRKNDVINRENCVIKIMTTKRS